MSVPTPVAAENESVEEASIEKGFQTAVSLAQGHKPAPTPPGSTRPLGSGMYSIGYSLARRISIKEFDGFITQLYYHLQLTLYRKRTDEDERFLKLKEFTTAMHYALLMRTSVTSKLLKGAGTPASWIDFQRNFEVPKPFGILLNSIGQCTVNKGTVEIFPILDISTEAEAVEDAFIEIKFRYLQFLNMIRSNATCPLEFISDKPEGNAYWTFDTVEAGDKTTPADATNIRIRVRCVYADASEKELEYAALAARGIVNTKFYKAGNISTFDTTTDTFEPQVFIYTPTFVNVTEDRYSFFAQNRKSK